MSLRLTALLVFTSMVAGAQVPNNDLPDSTGLARLKNYTAARASSDNRYVFSNDDSKRIMPGETLVMANLEGPGMVTHIWLTVADSEYAWPRLLRLRVYYDGEKTPSVDAPLGDFFGVGHGYQGIEACLRIVTAISTPTTGKSGLRWAAGTMRSSTSGERVTMWAPS